MLRRLLTLVSLLALLVPLAAHAAEKKLGKPLQLKTRTKVSELYAAPDKYKEKRVQLEGPVVGVCKKRGCWITLGGDKDFQSVTFKVEDGVIVFPADAVGKRAVVEGLVSVSTQSVEEQIAEGEHHAKEGGKPFDKSTVKGPKTVVMLRGEGAVIR